MLPLQPQPVAARLAAAFEVLEQEHSSAVVAAAVAANCDVGLFVAVALESVVAAAGFAVVAVVIVLVAELG